jgi:hypothetical protein
MEENTSQEVETPAEQAEHVHDENCQHDHFSVIEFFDLSKEDYDEANVAAKIQVKLGTSLDQMREALSKSVIDRAEELTLDFVNIAPMGDYEKLLENNDDMADFLKTEAHKLEHWRLFKIFESDVNKDLLSFVFQNVAIDDGENFEGFVFVTKSGKIKHAFARMES